MKKIMKEINCITWNLIDYMDFPEPLWDALESGKPKAYIAAFRFTIAHPLTAIDIVINH